MLVAQTTVATVKVERSTPEQGPGSIASRLHAEAGALLCTSTQLKENHLEKQLSLEFLRELHQQILLGIINIIFIWCLILFHKPGDYQGKNNKYRGLEVFHIKGSEKEEPTKDNEKNTTSILRRTTLEVQTPGRQTKNKLREKVICHKVLLSKIRQVLLISYWDKQPREHWGH